MTEDNVRAAMALADEYWRVICHHNPSLVQKKTAMSAAMEIATLAQDSIDAADQHADECQSALSGAEADNKRLRAELETAWMEVRLRGALASLLSGEPHG